MTFRILKLGFKRGLMMHEYAEDSLDQEPFMVLYTGTANHHRTLGKLRQESTQVSLHSILIRPATRHKGCEKA